MRDFETFEKSYNGLNEAIGKKGLLKPSEGADEQTMEAYQRQLNEYVGVPENGEYQFNIPESWGEGTGITQGLMDNLAKLGVSKGIGNDAFQGIVDTLGDTVAGMQAQAAEQFGTEDALKAEWGDKFDANSKAAEVFIENNLPEGKALMALPLFKKLAASLATRTGEDKMDTGATNQASAEALQDEINDVYKQQQDAMKTNDYNEQGRLQKRAQELIARQLAFKGG